MLNPEDRRAIAGLFDRLADAEQRAPQRDGEAEELIRSEISRLPNAPYYMAQTIVVQQQGLEAADACIRELEAQLAGREQPRQRSPWDRGADNAPEQRQQRGFGGGGGFLAGAMQTALGVAGGVMLGSAIGSLFGAGAANAADGNSAGDAGQDQGQESGQDSGDSGFDGGGDDFGGGDFDMGGDF